MIESSLNDRGFSYKKQKSAVQGEKDFLLGTLFGELNYRDGAVGDIGLYGPPK